MWLSSCIVCMCVLVNRVHFVYPASFAFPIALSWALPYDICALNSSLQCFTVKGNKSLDKRFFVKILAISQGVTRKLVVHTIQMHPFLNHAN